MGVFDPEKADDYGDVRDPFVLKRTLAGLEQRIEVIDEAIGAGTNAEATTVGADIDSVDGAFDGSGGHSYVVAGTVAFDAQITEIRMRLIGNGPAGSGTQYAKGVAYGGAGLGNLPTAALLGTGSEVSLTYGFPSQMVTFPFPSEVIIPAGDFSYGIHLHNGSTNQVVTIPYEDAADNTTLINVDSYSDGTTSPFGTLTGGYSWKPGIEIDLIPATTDVTDQIDALDARVTANEASIVTISATLDSQDDRLAAVESTASSGTSFDPTILSMTMPVGAGGVLTTDPIVLSGPRLVAALASSDQTMTLQVDTQATSGGSWTTGTPTSEAVLGQVDLMAVAGYAIRLVVENTSDTDAETLVTRAVAL